MIVMVTRQDYDGFAEQLAAIGRPIVVGFEATGISIFLATLERFPADLSRRGIHNDALI